jgi:DNA primase
MDVVALAQAGIPCAVASLGTATSETHFDKLFRYAPEVICCFDGDRAGRDAAWKALGIALPTLKQGRQLKFMFVPDGDDPDTLVRKEGKDAFAKRLNGALSAPEYLFQHLALGLDLTAMDDRARLAELAIPLVSTVPDGVLRELMMNRLAELAQLPVDALYRGARTVGRAPVGRTPKAVAAKQSRISERLLALLLQHPEFLLDLDPSRRDRLLDMPDSLVARVAQSALAQPDADTTVLLGYWSGDANHALLVQLADRTSMLEGEALQTEFLGAVDQVIANFAKSQRRALVSGLQEDASKDKLEAYWETRQQHPQGDSTKR